MSKVRITELSTQLRDAANLQDPTAGATLELIRLAFEEAKASLVTATGDDMLRQQGAAQQLQRIYKDLTIIPPSIK